MDTLCRTATLIVAAVALSTPAIAATRKPLPPAKRALAAVVETAHCPDVAWDPSLTAKAEAHLARGYEAAHRPRERATALSEWQAAAAMGYPKAQNDLGVALTAGPDRDTDGAFSRDMRGRSRTDEAAQQCFELAARQGHVRALVNLGGFHYKRGDFARAFSIYEKVLADCAPDKVCMEPHQAARALTHLRNIATEFIAQGDRYLPRVPGVAAENYALALAALCGPSGAGADPCRAPELAQLASKQWQVAAARPGVTIVADGSLAGRGSAHAMRLAGLSSNFDRLIETNPTAGGATAAATPATPPAPATKP